ncbi:hypothetical protein pb186bvf_013774 [Paramecium bursaria]
MGDFWEPTAQMFGSLFQKPKMSQKLLEKPPFKYVYDIILETQKVTGYGKGLYTAEELDGNYDNKEKKLVFLQKIIDLTQLMLKEEIAAKASKLISGLEPENTNLLLQAIYRAAVSGKSSDAFVKQILGGGAPTKKEEVKQAPPKEPAQPPAQPQQKPAQDKAQPPQKEKPPAQQVEKPPQAVQQAPPQPAQKPQEKPQEKPKEKTQIQQPAPQQLQQPTQAQIRPASANRGPPAIKQTQVVETTSKQTSGTANVIVEGKSNDDDDDMIITNNQPIVNKDINPDEQGKFVRDQMKKGKEIVEQQQQQAQQNDGGIKMQRKAKQGKDTIRQQIAQNLGTSQVSDADVMQKLIQQITQNTNPLGKQLEFIQDDIESMNYELQQWRKVYNTSKQKMVEMSRATEEAQQPLFDKIAEVEEMIRDKKTKIQHLKAQIIKNKLQVDTLLKSVMVQR